MNNENIVQQATPFGYKQNAKERDKTTCKDVIRPVKKGVLMGVQIYYEKATWKEQKINRIN